MIWPQDTTAAKNKFYGDFRVKSFEPAHLTRITPPFQMYYAKKKISSLLVNKGCALDLMDVFDEIFKACDRDPHKVDLTGASDFGGCFNVRPIAGAPGVWSNHSWACAIDLSPSTNGFNTKGTLSHIVIDTFKAHGWRWGGDYKSGRTDPMHFEAISPVQNHREIV